MRAYHRIDPLMDERKSDYTPAQLGAFVKVQLLAGRQKYRGRFRSLAALTGALPASYARHVPFLFEQGDLAGQPDGSVYLPGWDEWQEGDLTVRERMARLRQRQSTHRNNDRHAAVTPPVTEPSQSRNLPLQRSSVSVSVRDKASTKPRVVAPSPSSSSPTNGPRLTREQLAAWASFDRPEWQPFKTAWLARGFLWPPSGSDGDDDTSQRGLLWSIADARPHDLGRWVTEAKGKTARAIIDHVLARWHEVRVDSGVEDAEWEEAKTAERRGASRTMTRLGEALAKVVQPDELDFGEGPAA